MTGGIPGHSQRDTFKLECGCKVLFAKPWPERDELVYCRKHERYSYRLGEPEPIPMWRYHCETVGCTRPNRSFGLNRLRAQSCAAKHGLLKLHTVAVWHGDQLVHKIRPQSETLSLGKLTDDPPF
jgi:hypothetical protein